MNTEELIRMANQIARFFDSYPEAEARVGVREHIERFWEPRMRRQLLAYIGTDGTGLLPLVSQALRSSESS